jgi:hypothetical protein
MLKYFWKSSTPEELAQAEIEACFYALTAQKESVAEKRKAYDLVRVVTEQAKQSMDKSKFLYDTAVQVMGEDSKEASDLNITHRIRQAEYKLKWQQLADARSALDLAIAERDKKQTKYDQAQGIKAPETAQIPEQSKLPGKIALPEAVVAHFEGKNREHVSTEQSEAVRQELVSTRPSINFAQMHKKLAKTLHLSSANNASSQPPVTRVESSSSNTTSVTLNPLFMGAHPSTLPFREALEEKLRRMNEPKPTLNEELKAAITARRAQFKG